MNDPILQAINFADRPEHNGNGYTLRVCLVSGAYLEVGVHFDELEDYLLRRIAPGAEFDAEPVFINPANVESVMVQW